MPKADLVIFIKKGKVDGKPQVFRAEGGLDNFIWKGKADGKPQVFRVFRVFRVVK